MFLRRFKAPALGYFVTVSFALVEESGRPRKNNRPVIVSSKCTCTSGVRTHNLSVDWLLKLLLRPLGHRDHIIVVKTQNSSMQYEHTTHSRYKRQKEDFQITATALLLTPVLVILTSKCG